MSPVLARNIGALQERRSRELATAGLSDRIADAVTRFAGSMTFVAIHAVVFGFWTAVNVGWVPAVPKWDESFVILGTSASVEAIFLSTFVLISQNRMAAADAKRTDLALQVALLSEHEVTRLMTLTTAIARHFGIRSPIDPEIPEIERDVAPEAVLDELDAREKAGRRQG